MKAKVLFIGAICALSVYSCSPDMDEQIENPTEKIKFEKLEFKKLKPLENDSVTVNKTSSDSIHVSPPMMSSPASGVGIEPTDPNPNPNPNPDPNEGDDPKNVPPRK